MTHLVAGIWGQLLQTVGWFPWLVATHCMSEFSFYTWSGYCMFLYLVSSGGMQTETLLMQNMEPTDTDVLYIYAMEYYSAIKEE